jgi:hypothetical protein
VGIVEFPSNQPIQKIFAVFDGMLMNTEHTDQNQFSSAFFSARPRPYRYNPIS